MLYDRILPPMSLSSLIDCYWVVESNDLTISRQKIIPDGFPEIIFHYGDPYRINISGKWETQSKQLLAGQIRNHFLLENTGLSGMIGIKLKPHALAGIFFIEMSEYTDEVVDLMSVLSEEFEEICPEMISDSPYKSKVEKLNSFFETYLPSVSKSDKIEQAIQLIFEKKAALSVSDIAEMISISERQLERLFKRYIGLSPKFYCRIIRFNHIFELIQKEEKEWGKIAQLTGFYDQSHFIKNFKEFTGEDPTKYFFDEKNMANFFLKKE